MAYSTINSSVEILLKELIAKMNSIKNPLPFIENLRPVNNTLSIDEYYVWASIYRFFFHPFEFWNDTCKQKKLL